MTAIARRHRLLATFTVLTCWLYAAPSAVGQVTAAREYAARTLPGLPPGIVEGACKEGSVMLYHLVFRGNLKSLIDTFQSRFPCLSVKTFMASGGPLAQRFTTEYRAGTYVDDVWMNSSPLFANDLAGKGMLLEWRPPTAELVPEIWKNEGFWYAVGLAHIGIGWNADEVSAEQRRWLEQVTSWQQVAEAPFKGQTAMVDIRAGGTTQLPYYFFKEKYGIQFWQKLAALGPSIFSAVNPLADRLVTGEFAFVPAVTADTAMATRWLQGAPLRWRFLEPGLAVPYLLAVSSKAPHPNAAKLFLAWSLSADGQTAWVNSTGLAPVSSHAKDERPYAREPWYRLPKTYFQPDWDAVTRELGALTEQFTSMFGK